jgi:hypothetical protein
MQITNGLSTPSSVAMETRPVCNTVSSTKNARAGRLSMGDRGKRRAVSFGRIRVKKIEGQTGRFVKTLGLSL